MAMEQKDILSFQVQRSISSLCKNFLNMLEDLSEEYERYFENPEEPPENFLDNKHFDHLRKRVLDKGGDTARDLIEELNKYEVRLSEKVKE